MTRALRETVSLLLAGLLLCALVGCSLLPQLPAPDDSSAVDTSAPEDTSLPEGDEEPEERPLLAEDGDGLYQPPTDPMAEAVCVVNEETGLVVYERNSSASMPAASLVKMMTCIVVMEQAKRFGWDLDATLVDSSDEAWIYDELYGVNASTADVRRGEVLSLRELLYGALVPSGNECAMLLANFACTGYMDNFYYMMNTRARTLGCTGTWFADVTGLSEASVTTARDMARITSEFMRYPELVEIAATSTYTMAAHEEHANEYNIFTTNRLLVKSSPYYIAMGSAAGTLLGGKTGSLGEWQNFASKAVRGGEGYVCVVLHSPNEADTVRAGIAFDPESESEPGYRPALVEAGGLYDWAFSTFQVASALDITQPATELRVQYSTDADTVRLMPSGDVRAVLPKSDEDAVMLSRIYTLPQSVPAPVEEGAVMGDVTLYIGKHAVGTVQLVTQTGVQRNHVMYWMAQVGDFFAGTYFRVLVMLVLGCGVLYAAGLALAANSRARKRKAAPAAAESAPSGTKKSTGKKAPQMARAGGAGPARRKKRAPGAASPKRGPAKGEGGSSARQPRQSTAADKPVKVMLSSQDRRHTSGKNSKPHR